LSYKVRYCIGSRYIIPKEKSLPCYIGYLFWKQYNCFYKKIGQLSVYNLNEFIDYNSNTNTESCKYKIGVVDSCGRNIEFDEIHKTILLSGSLTENDFIQLNWNPYEGFPYEYFALERRVSGGEFHAIATVPNNSFSYTDTDPLSGIAEYRIKVRPYEQYIPDSINYQFSISNIMNTSGLGIENLISNSFNIYPNPANDILIIKSTNNENINSISLIDEYGRLVYKNENLFHKNLKINLQNNYFVD